MYNDTYAHIVRLLSAMRDWDRKQPDGEHYGAQIQHWGNTGFRVNIDADALNALIGYYMRRDEQENRQARKPEQGQMAIAADVCAKRFYRVYADVPEDASDEQIENAVKDEMLSMTDDELEKCIDLGLGLEEDDITAIEIDHDSLAYLNE